MKETLAALQPNIDNGVLALLSHTERELIVYSSCPDDNDTMLGGAMCIYNIEGMAIIVGDAYMKFSDDVKEFVYHHEVAHYVHGDTFVGNTIEHEIKADLYAMERTSRKVAIKSLKAIIKAVKRYKANNKSRKYAVNEGKKAALHDLKLRLKEIKKGGK